MLLYTACMLLTTLIWCGVLAGKAVAEVSCGILHVLARGESGDVYTWGDGSSGQLGHGDLCDQLLPRRVAGELEGKQVQRNI